MSERNASEATEVWREPVRGGTGDPSLARMRGVDALRTWLDGRSPRPPVARLTGRRLHALGVGWATYTLPVTPWLLGPKGRVHPGVLAFLAGTPLFGAVQSSLPASTSCTTPERRAETDRVLRDVINPTLAKAERGELFENPLTDYFEVPLSSFFSASGLARGYYLNLVKPALDGLAARKVKGSSFDRFQVDRRCCKSCFRRGSGSRPGRTSRNSSTAADGYGRSRSPPQSQGHAS